MHNILVAPLCGMIDTLLEGTLEMRHRFGATSKPHLGAQVVAAPLARPAVVTRHTDFQSNAFTNLVTRDILTNCNDNSSRLMA
jgi:hypothetical protein